MHRFSLQHHLTKEEISQEIYSCTSMTEILSTSPSPFMMHPTMVYVLFLHVKTINLTLSEQSGLLDMESLENSALHYIS
jgi:hypothetical protein